MSGGSDPLAQSLIEIVADTSKFPDELTKNVEKASSDAAEAASKIFNEQMGATAAAAAEEFGTTLDEGLTVAATEGAETFGTAFGLKLEAFGEEAAAQLVAAFKAAMRPAVEEDGEEEAQSFLARFKATMETGMAAVAEKMGIELEESSAGISEAGAAIGDKFVEGVKLGGVALAGVTAEMTKFGLEGAASIQKSQIAFEHMTGSAQAGVDVVNQLEQQAAKTPFQFQDLQPVAQRFLAIGDAAGITSKNVTQFTGALEDATTFAGGTPETMNRVAYALDEVASKGKLTQASVTQLSRDLPGLNVQQVLAAGSGQTLSQIQAQIHAGTLTASAGIQDYIKGLEKMPGVAGSAAAASATLGGSFATLKDNIRLSLTQGFTPVIPEITKVMNSIVPVLNQGFEKLGPVIGQALAAILPLIAQLFTALVPIIAPLVQLLAGIAPSLIQSLSVLSPVFAQIAQSLVPLAPVIGQLVVMFTQLALQAIKPFLPLLSALLPILQGATTVLKVLSPVLVPLIQAWIIWASVTKVLSIAMGVLNLVLDANPFVLIGIAVVALIAGLVELYQHSKLVREIVGDVVHFFATVAIDALHYFEAGWRVVIAAVKDVVAFFQKMPGYFHDAMGEISKILDDAWRGIVAGAKAVLDFFTALPGEILNALIALPGELLHLFLDGLALLLHGIGDILGLIIVSFELLYKGIVYAVTELPGELWNLFTSALSMAKDAVVAGAKAVIDFVVSWNLAILHELEALPGQLWTLFTTAMSLVGKAVDTGISDTISFFRALPGEVVHALATIGSDLANVFSSMWDKASAVVTKGIDTLVGWFKAIPGKISDLGKDLEASGEKLIKSVFDGFSKVPSIGENIAKSVVNAVISAINWAIDQVDSGLADINIAGIGFPKKTIPDIPPWKASGGIFDRPTVIGVGEAGKEVVLPLTNPARTAALAAQSGLLGVLSQAGIGGGRPTQIFQTTVNTVAQDPVMVATQTVGKLARKVA